MRYMNFVYNSRVRKKRIVINHIKYEWDGIDIRDYLSDETIKGAYDIVIADKGGISRVLNYKRIASNTKYQVIDRFTPDCDIKSKYLLICPKLRTWLVSEIMAEGQYKAGEKYLEIVDEEVGEMEVIDIASNLSYMYGIRFVPHMTKTGLIYRITSEEDFPEVWKDISENVDRIKKYYKLGEAYVDSARKDSKCNETKITEESFEW